MSHMTQTVLMVGGPAHGKRWPAVDSGSITYTATTYGREQQHTYHIEHLTTHDPANHKTHHVIAVHSDLLLHRKIRRDSIMHQANEDALQAYLLDAAMRACAL